MAEIRPTCSVVIATYNRSRALRCAIESVIRQGLQDWEMIVVGDACTDDTADVVASFGDQRIRFINLLQNFGEQAGPSNVGIAEARADLVAFLNHDDLWLPDHLELCREFLLAHHADLVFGTAAGIGAKAPLPLQFDQLHVALIGLGPNNRWSPAELEGSVASASSLVVRREVLTQVGGWRLGREIHVEPSQDLVFRVWKAGYRIRAVNIVTLVLVTAGHRHGSYVGNPAHEQEWLLDRIREPTFGVELAAQALETNAAFNRRAGSRPLLSTRLLATALAKLGVNPRSIVFRLCRGYSKGTYVNRLRAIRGLPSLGDAVAPGPSLRREMVRRSCRISRGDVVHFAAGGRGARFLAAGWSRPDAVGVWNDGTSAELMFDLSPVPTDVMTFSFGLRPFLGDGSAVRQVRISVGDSYAQTLEIAADYSGFTQIKIPIDAIRGTLLALSFHFVNPESPQSVGLSDDPRMIAIGLLWVRWS